MSARLVGLALVAAVLAGLLASRDDRERTGGWQAPGLVELRTAHGEVTARDLSRDRGRLVARRDLDAVLAWIPGPRRLAVLSPRGPVELVIGERTGPGLVLEVGDEQLSWSAPGHGRAEQLTGSAPRGDADELTWQREDDGWRLLAGGEELARLPGGHLAEEALGRIGFGAGASARGFAVITESGQEKVVDLSADPDAGRVPWAAGSALLAVLALSSWWTLLRGRRESGAVDRLLAGVVALALAVLPAWRLQRTNAERLSAPVPEGSAPDLELAGPLELSLGRPLNLTRREDADAVLEARVTLEPDSVLDISLRRDGLRSVIACLSTAADVPSAMVWNRGHAVEVEAAPPGLARLPAGEALPLRIDLTGPDVRVRIGDGDLGRVWDWDLRRGGTSLHVLRGSATVRDLSLSSLGTPEDTSPHLWRWQLGLALMVLGGLTLLAVLARGRGPLCWLWAWPLVLGAAPGAPDAALEAGVTLAGLSLLLGTAGGWRWWPQVAAGSLLIGAVHWAGSEAPDRVEARELSVMTPGEVSGGPYAARLMWARHPLSRRFNAFLEDQAFRGRRLPQERAATRVVAVGGSSTFGYGVPAERAWPAALEKRLVAAGHDVEVLNGGVPGITVWRLVSFVQEALLPLDVDVLIVSVGFNDHPVGAVWREAEHLAAMADEGVGPLAAAYERWREGRRQDAWNGYSRDVLNGVAVDADARREMADEPSARFAAGLAALHDACQRAGTRLLLVQEPCRGGHDRPLLEPYRRALASLAAERGLPVVEPQPALDAQGGDSLYLDTVHPTARGHGVEAAVIAAGLEDAGLL